MNKKTLDMLGGVGSLMGSLLCIYFAQSHDVHESMWTVWVVFSVLLALNGVAMLIYANRVQRDQIRMGR